MGRTVVDDTVPDLKGADYYGPSGFAEIAGRAAHATIPKHARIGADNRRLWTVSEEVTGVRYPH